MNVMCTDRLDPVAAVCTCMFTRPLSVNITDPYASKQASKTARAQVAADGRSQRVCRSEQDSRPSNSASFWWCQFVQVRQGQPYQVNQFPVRQVFGRTCQHFREKQYLHARLPCDRLWRCWTAPSCNGAGVHPSARTFPLPWDSPRCITTAGDCTCSCMR